MKTINHDELNKLISKREDFVLLNALSEEDFQKAHIPGSMNFPVDKADFLQEVEMKVPEKGKKIIAYCSGPSCDASLRAAQKLVDAGYTNVFRFEGGIKEWKKAGFRLEGRAAAA